VQKSSANVGFGSRAIIRHASTKPLAPSTRMPAGVSGDNALAFLLKLSLSRAGTAMGVEAVAEAPELAE
jgi:hypothetical protein